MSIFLNINLFVCVFMATGNYSTMAQKGVKASPFEQPELVSKLVSANTEFAVDLYMELCKSHPSNIFFSPVSISLALAMAYLGAREKTAAEMKQTLKLTALSDEDVHEAYKEMNQVLHGDSSYILRTANRIFASKSYTFLQDFLDATKKFYNAEAQVLDFAGDAEGSRKTINSWVKDQTASKINNLLPEDSLDATTALVLVNAIYFKGDWLDKFKAVFTKSGKFDVTAAYCVDVQMMNQEQDMPFGMNKEFDCKIVELPYEEKELSMFIILPNQVNGLGELEKKITSDVLQKLTSEMGIRYVELSLPKFKLEHQFSVKDKLMARGMKDFFTAGKADLSKMDGTKQLYASDVIHKAFIEVNEKGSEAAAATAVCMDNCCIQGEVFNADHPFLFFIRDNRSKGILFMGRLANPA